MRIKKYYKMVKVDYEDEGLFEISNITSTPGTITVNNSGIMDGATLQYSTDGANWTTAVFSSNVCEITLPANGNCYFKGTNFRRTDSNAIAMFNCDVNHNAKGNLYSLIDPVNYASATQSYNIMFYSLFSGNTHLIDAGGLMLPVGVASIGENGLYNAFKGCSYLITAADLSNVTSIGNNGLSYAFFGCYKLQTIYAPNVDTWETSKFNKWVSGAGTQATNPQMIFQSQAHLDLCPSGDSGFGSYSKILAS